MGAGTQTQIWLLPFAASSLPAELSSQPLTEIIFSKVPLKCCLSRDGHILKEKHPPVAEGVPRAWMWLFEQITPSVTAASGSVGHMGRVGTASEAMNVETPPVSPGLGQSLDTSLGSETAEAGKVT